MSTIDLNINDTVKVKLTQAGFQIACDAGYQNTATNIDVDGYSSFQLWILMEIFGPHLYHGMPNTLFEQNRIRVTGTEV